MALANINKTHWGHQNEKVIYCGHNTNAGDVMFSIKVFFPLRPYR